MLLKFSLSLSWPSWPDNWGENGEHSNWHLINCSKILYSNFLVFPCETLRGLDVPSKSTSSIRQKFEPLLQFDYLKSIQWSTKTCCLLSDIWKCKMCSWGGIAGRCMKARTANRAVRTYKEKQSKNIQCINITTSKLSCPWIGWYTAGKGEVCRQLSPLTPKISWVILSTVCHTIYVMIVWRIWNWINQ